MSDIPMARNYLMAALRETDPDMVKRIIRMAIKIMTRETPIRRSSERSVDLTPAVKRHIRQLAQNKSLTMHQIASMAGVRNSGRVSEVLNGKR